MTLDVPFEPQDEADLIAIAHKRGMSADQLVREAIRNILADSLEISDAKKPTRSLRGVLTKYGPAPSAAEIDQNRTEMFANFPRTDF